MLFQYVNGDGVPQAVTSADVNAYIRDATGGDFTAKHFRTWGASVIFFDQLLKKDEEKRLSLKTALEPVAEALGNTPAISRKSYVHPKLIDALQEDPRDPLHGIDPPAAAPPPVQRRNRASSPSSRRSRRARRKVRGLNLAAPRRHKRGHEESSTSRPRRARSMASSIGSSPTSTGWRSAR